MKKIHIFTLLLIIILSSFICSYKLLKYYSVKMSPVVFSYAESEVKKITTLIINKSITKQMSAGLDVDNLLNITRNDNGDIQMISYNSITVTKLLNSVTNLVQLNIKSIEEGNIDLLELPDIYDEEKMKYGIVYEIPLGTVTDNFLLANIGYKIPVKFTLVGSTTTNLDTKITEYGINNALLEIFITIDVTTQINIPFVSKEVNMSTQVPIAIKLIQGIIPEYYINGLQSEKIAN